MLYKADFKLQPKSISFFNLRHILPIACSVKRKCYLCFSKERKQFSLISWEHLLKVKLIIESKKVALYNELCSNHSLHFIQPTNWLALPSLMSEQSLTILVMCHVVQMRNSLFMIFIFCFLIFVYTYYGYLLVSCCQYQFVNFVNQGFT